MTAAAVPPLRTADLRVEDYGDAAVMVTVEGVTAMVAWPRLHALAGRLTNLDVVGIEGIVATFDSILIEFDPRDVAVETLCELIHRSDGPPAEGGREAVTHRVPVLYGGDDGPDLSDVADELGLTAAEFVEQHSNTLWRIAFIGAPAGAPVHDGSPFADSIARCTQPRLRVPAGSVAVSGHQGVIYPIDTPGGWRLVGRTPLTVIDIAKDPHVGYVPGDFIQFVPVSADEAESLIGVPMGGWP